MTAWQRLAIEPTSDQREIKRAYAKQLKTIDQDTQAEVFILLREALQEAQAEAEMMAYESEYEEDVTPSIIYDVNVTTDTEISSTTSAQIEMLFVDLEQQITSQNIKFNITDAIIQFGIALQTVSDQSVKTEYLERLRHLLQQFQLEDFLELASCTATTDPSALEETVIHHDQEYSYHQASADTDIPDHESTSPLAQLHQVSDALWDQNISDTVFDKFTQLLTEQSELTLAQQIQIKDQLIGPLAEIEADVLNPEYSRFLDLWNTIYSDDIHHYDYAYYSNILQSKLDTYQSNKLLLQSLPSERNQLLQLLSGTQKFQPFRMLKLQRQLGKDHPQLKIIDLLNQFHLPNTEQNINFSFLKSLAVNKKFIFIDLIFAISTFVFLQTFWGKQLTGAAILLSTAVFSLLFIFLIQPAFHAIMTTHSDQETRLIRFSQIWFLTGLVLCSFIHWFNPTLHQVLSYGWILLSVFLFGCLQLVARPDMNQLLQSSYIHFDRWMMLAGLVTLCGGFAFIYYTVGHPHYPWLLVYSLIPAGFLLLPDSFRPLFAIFGYRKQQHNLTDKAIFYRSIGIVCLRLIWMFSFTYFLVSAQSQPYMYLGCIGFAALLLTTLNTRKFSSCLKYLSYLGIMYLTLMTYIIPLVIGSYLFLSIKTKREQNIS